MARNRLDLLFGAPVPGAGLVLVAILNPGYDAGGALQASTAMPKQTDLVYYQYHTHAGTVSLLPEAGGRYKVMFGGDNLGSYHSPEAAADDVSGGHTFVPPGGADLGALGIPGDLGEWDKKPFATIKRLRPS